MTTEKPRELNPAVLRARLSARPVNVSSWLANHVPGADSLPSDPWGRWLLLALYRHLPRQAFVAEVVRERLSGSEDRLHGFGAFGHPEGLDDEGRVPRLPEWSYFFHGRGCCLTKDDGTCIDVDFDEHGHHTIDPYFFNAFLESLPAPGLVESRLRPNAGVRSKHWMASIQSLLDARLLEGDHGIRLSAAASAWCSQLSEALNKRATDPLEFAWLACQIEDYELACSLLGPAASLPLAQRASEQTRSRAEWLAARVRSRSGMHRDACLDALRQLDDQRALDVATEQLRVGNPDGVMSRVLQMVHEWHSREHFDLVVQLLGRIVGNEPPAPYLRVTASRFLLSFFRADTVPEDLRERVLRTLGEDARACEADAALLHYLLEPDAGLARLTRGLDDNVPLAREECAAALAAIGTADAVEALRRHASIEAVTTLRMLHGHEVVPGPKPRGEVVEWRGRKRRVYTFNEIHAANLPGQVVMAVTSFREKWDSLLATWFAN